MPLVRTNGTSIAPYTGQGAYLNSIYGRPAKAVQPQSESMGYGTINRPAQTQVSSAERWPAAEPMSSAERQHRQQYQQQQQAGRAGTEPHWGSLYPRTPEGGYPTGSVPPPLPPKENVAGLWEEFIGRGDLGVKSPGGTQGGGIPDSMPLDLGRLPQGGGVPIGPGVPLDYSNIPFASRFQGPRGVTTVSDLVGIDAASGFEPPSRFPTWDEVHAQNLIRQREGLPALQWDTIQKMNLLGPFGSQYFDPTRGFNPKDMTFVEARLNLANLARADIDRKQADQYINQMMGLIGQSPEASQARMVASERLANPAVLSPEERQYMLTDIRDRASIGLQEGLQGAEEELAARGIVGGPVARTRAELTQESMRQANDLLRRVAVEQAVLDRQEETRALQQVDEMAARDEARRLALGLDRTELLVPTRGDISLAGITAASAKKPKSSGLISGLFDNLA